MFGIFFIRLTEASSSSQNAELITHPHEKRLPILLRCDANSLYVVWGSSYAHPKNEALLHYLAPTNLIILNRGYDPIFVNGKSLNPHSESNPNIKLAYKSSCSLQMPKAKLP